MKKLKKSKEFGDRLTFVLNEKGMTIAELSRRSGISWCTLKAYTQGQIPYYCTTLSTIARILDVRADYLLKGYIENGR